MVNMIAPHTARVRRHSRELDIEAQIVVSAGAFEAFPTGHAGLDGDAVACFKVADFGPRPDDLSRAFVAQAVLGLDFEASDAAGVPEVDVRAGVVGMSLHAGG